MIALVNGMGKASWLCPPLNRRICG